MQTLRSGMRLGLFVALALTTASVACKGGNKDGASAGKADANPPTDENRRDDGPEVAAMGSAGPGSGGTPSDASASSGAAGSGEPAPASTGDSGGAGGSGDSGGSGADPAAKDATGGDSASAATGGGPDIKELLKSLRSRRTRDTKATEIVAELEAADIDTAELAKALVSRGQALHASPDRAKVMFELALEKDSKLPDPAFELAKQAAVLGELEEAKKWLKTVKQRNGKRLLQQIDFDPMWEILKDDPDVRALIQ